MRIRRKHWASLRIPVDLSVCTGTEVVRDRANHIIYLNVGFRVIRFYVVLRFNFRKEIEYFSLRCQHLRVIFGERQSTWIDHFFDASNILPKAFAITLLKLSSFVIFFGNTVLLTSSRNHTAIASSVTGARETHEPISKSGFIKQDEVGSASAFRMRAICFGKSELGCIFVKHDREETIRYRDYPKTTWYIGISVSLGGIVTIRGGASALAWILGSKSKIFINIYNQKNTIVLV